MTKSKKGWRQEGHPAIKHLLQTTRMPDENVFAIPHRLSRGLTRGAPAGRSLARGDKCATATGVGPTTSWPPCNVAGETDDGRKGVDMRIGSVNVGTMRGRSGEIAEMAARRRLDICCVQETRWKGGSARNIGCDDGWYKFFWVGCEDGVAGVGVLVVDKWIDSVVEVRWVSERVMVLRLAIGKSVLNVSQCMLLR